MLPVSCLLLEIASQMKQPGTGADEKCCRLAAFHSPCAPAKIRQQEGRGGDQAERAKDKGGREADIGLQPAADGRTSAEADAPGDGVEAGEGGAVPVGDLFHGEGGVDWLDQG